MLHRVVLVVWLYRFADNEVQKVSSWSFCIQILRLVILVVLVYRVADDKVQNTRSLSFRV